LFRCSTCCAKIFATSLSRCFLFSFFSRSRSLSRNLHRSIYVNRIQRAPSDIGLAIPSKDRSMLCRVIYASCECVCILQMPVVFAVALFHPLSPSPFGVPELFLSPLDSLVGFGFHFSGTSAQFSSHTLSLFQPHLSFLFSFCTHAFLNIAYEISITSQTACIASLKYPAPPYLATHSLPVFPTPHAPISRH